MLVGTREIAPIMRHAIVAIEDKRFWEHEGVDIRGIARAAWADIRHQRFVQGGSTIPQQFIKNAYAENERSFARKVREAALARQLSQRWSKARILTAYLNTIYFGNGAYGVERAATTYFHKKAIELNARRGGPPGRNPRRPEPLRPGRPQRRRGRGGRSCWWRCCRRG